jgi:LysM repeat protein
VLWTAGGWLKNRDSQTADLFYKALVRRNRKTKLGDEADRQRWFPEIDGNGEIIHRERSTRQPEAAPLPPADPDSQVPEGMTEYVVEAGDSVATIAHKFRIPVTKLLEANPYLLEIQLKVGQRILIPDAE